MTFDVILIDLHGQTEGDELLELLSMLLFRGHWLLSP